MKIRGEVANGGNQREPGRLGTWEARRRWVRVEQRDERTCDDAPPESDEQAGTSVGPPFVQLEDEEKWAKWVDWDSLSHV